MNFPSKIFSNDINHGYRAAILKKNSLWLLPFYALWLLISIMKRCAERCAQQLYQTCLKYSVVSLDSTSSQEFIVVQSTLLGCFTVTFHLYIHSILVNPFPFWLWWQSSLNLYRTYIFVFGRTVITKFSWVLFPCKRFKSSATDNLFNF